VTAADVDVNTHTAQAVFDDTRTSVEQIKETLAQNGYPASSYHFLLNAKETENMIETRPELIVLDVRERSEFCGQGHIPSARNYPWNSGVLQEKYTDFSGDSQILVLCGSGTRSNLAAAFLDSKGFTAVYDAGGMNIYEGETLTCAREIARNGLKNIISILQIMVDGKSDQTVDTGDADGDGKIGLPDIGYLLKTISEIR
jgi:rhodanese-related sulfurtransferase